MKKIKTLISFQMIKNIHQKFIHAWKGTFNEPKAMMFMRKNKENWEMQNIKKRLIRIYGIK